MHRYITILDKITFTAHSEDNYINTAVLILIQDQNVTLYIAHPEFHHFLLNVSVFDFYIRHPACFPMPSSLFIAKYVFL